MAQVRVNILPSGTTLAETGATAPVDVRFLDQVAIFVDFETSGIAFAIRIQGTIDGFSWVDIPADTTMLSDDTVATDKTASTDKSNLDAGRLGIGSVYSIVNTVAMTSIRLKWIAPGGSRDVKIDLEGK